jgi:phosphoribosylformimino-5-aminoimidazole carboxamide ribotide isomerase
VQVGGGLRTAQAVSDVLARGVSRVVLGTAAYDDIDLVDEVVAEYGDRVVVSIDTRDGQVATKGWTEQSSIPAESVIERLGHRGVRRFVYSSIERDGMLTGPDLDAVQRIAQVVRGQFVYSGGISSLEDLRALASLRQVNLSGVIIGKALYEGRFGIAEAIEALK